MHASRAILRFIHTTPYKAFMNVRLSILAFARCPRPEPPREMSIPESEGHQRGGSLEYAWSCWESFHIVHASVLYRSATGVIFEKL